MTLRSLHPAAQSTRTTPVPHLLTAAARAAHFRRQQDDSRCLLTGMVAEREMRAAAIPQDGPTAAQVLADLSAAIDHAAGASR